MVCQGQIGLAWAVTALSVGEPKGGAFQPNQNAVCGKNRNAASTTGFEVTAFSNELTPPRETTNILPTMASQPWRLTAARQCCKALSQFAPRTPVSTTRRLLSTTGPASASMSCSPLASPEGTITTDRLTRLVPPQSVLSPLLPPPAPISLHSTPPPTPPTSRTA